MPESQTKVTPLEPVAQHVMELTLTVSETGHKLAHVILYEVPTSVTSHHSVG